MAVDFHFHYQVLGQAKLFVIHIKIDETHEHLLITDTEILCWMEQLRQAVSELSFIPIKFPYKFDLFSLVILFRPQFHLESF